jgi:hypothetical protein
MVGVCWMATEKIWSPFEKLPLSNGDWMFFNHHKDRLTNFFQSPQRKADQISFNHNKGQLKWDMVWWPKSFGHHPIFIIFWMVIELFQMPQKGGCHMFLRRELLTDLQKKCHRPPFFKRLKNLRLPFEKLS